MKEYQLYYRRKDDHREDVTVCIIAINNYEAQIKARNIVFGSNIKSFDLVSVSYISDIKEKIKK